MIKQGIRTPWFEESLVDNNLLKSFNIMKRKECYKIKPKERKEI